jgi:hypothetical protein
LFRTKRISVQNASSHTHTDHSRTHAQQSPDQVLSIEGQLPFLAAGPCPTSARKRRLAIPASCRASPLRSCWKQPAISPPRHVRALSTSTQASANCQIWFVRGRERGSRADVRDSCSSTGSVGYRNTFYTASGVGQPQTERSSRGPECHASDMSKFGYQI